MNHDEFIGEVQNRTQLPSRGDAQRVTRATLTTLSERLQEGQAENLAAQLPDEIDHHLEKVSDVERFEYDEFVDRVAEREETDDRAAVVFHARTVLDVVDDVVSEGSLVDVRNGLPDEYEELFELVDADEPPKPEEQRGE